MRIHHGSSKSEHGPGVAIELTGDEVALAIDAWLIANGVLVNGPRTVTVNGDLCERGRVFVDPSGFVYHSGIVINGWTHIKETKLRGEFFQIQDFDEQAKED